MIAGTSAQHYLVALLNQKRGERDISVERPTPLRIVAKQIARSAGDQRDAGLVMGRNGIGGKQIGRYGSEILNAIFIRKIAENSGKLGRVVPFPHQLECARIAIEGN
jgi:hypothetical protein